MGTWGHGIFDNDIALDMRGEFEEALAEGLDAHAATQRVIATYEESFEDFDEAPMVRLALAGLQLEHGSLEPWVRHQALAVIDADPNLERWLEGWDAGRAEAEAERRKVLEGLKARLAAA